MNQKEIDAKRYWTPRILLMTVTLHVCGLGLWYFVTSWMSDIKTEVREIHSELTAEIHQATDRRLVWTAWKQETIDHVANMEDRIVRLERKSAMR